LAVQRAGAVAERHSSVLDQKLIAAGQSRIEPASAGATDQNDMLNRDRRIALATRASYSRSGD
jgi:hypothetical protein